MIALEWQAVVHVFFCHAFVRRDLSIRPMTPKRPMEIMQDTVDGPRQLALEPDAPSKHLALCVARTSMPEP